MESPPSSEMVVAAINSLYRNPDSKEKERASNWLQALQKSVFAWKVCDELLHLKPDLETCYIAAQTMRTKIQVSFHEVPPEAHASLRDSLLEHLLSIDESTSSVIVTQLSLAMADLILLMPEWPDPVAELTRKLGPTKPWSLLEVLVVLPEEVGSRHLRLGANRRSEIMNVLKSSAPLVIDFTRACMQEKAPTSTQYKTGAYKCLTSWLQVGAVPLEGIEQNVVMVDAFRTLSHLDCPPGVHESAADCVTALLVRLEELDCDMEIGSLELSVFAAVRKLEEPYHLAVATEDLEKAINLCRVFTELGETMLAKIVSHPSNLGPHFAVAILDNVLMCCGHPDYEMPDMTFNLWYRLSEELYQKNDDNLTVLFRPYVERLIQALCRHCQMEPDSEELVGEEGGDFSDFRCRVVELIKDVVFIVGSANVFKHMLANLGHHHQTSSWETTESALFIMAAVARNLYPSEANSVPAVMEAILGQHLPQHVAVRHTSLRLVGELCEWIDNHPQYLERILNWLLLGLHEAKLASQAATALQNICSQCSKHMCPHLDGLIQILQSLDSFGLKPAAAIGLIKGVAMLLSTMPHPLIARGMKTLCDLQLHPLASLVEAHDGKAGGSCSGNGKMMRNTTGDPVLYLDRLAAIFRHVTPTVEPGQPHPAANLVVHEVWPLLSRTCHAFCEDPRVMERSCRTLRFVVRCVGVQSAPLLEPLVKMLVSLYITHPHSCFLYLGSILVDEYAYMPGCVDGLLEMLKAFLPPTFALLNTIPAANGHDDGGSLLALRSHPDTVDDFFRLNARFLQRASMPYLSSEFMPSVVECALMSCALDHRDANGSVMKFFFDLLHLGRTKEDREDFPARSATINHLRQEYGPRLVESLVQAAIFHLPSYTFQDVGDVLFELMLLDRASVCHWLEATLKALPGQQQQSITRAQLAKFHRTVTAAEEPNKVSEAIREFTRLWR